MKKIIMIAAVAIFGLAVAGKVFAIEDQDPVGTIYAGAQVGFAPGFGGNISADYVLVDSWWKGHFAVGLALGSNGRTKKQSTAFGKFDYKYSYFEFAPRALYGLNLTDQLEVHTGLIAGLARESWKSKDLDTKDSGLHLCYGWFAGAKYYFTDNIGASADINYSGYMTYINAGICFRF